MSQWKLNGIPLTIEFFELDTRDIEVDSVCKFPLLCALLNIPAKLSVVINIGKFALGVIYKYKIVSRNSL